MAVLCLLLGMIGASRAEIRTESVEYEQAGTVFRGHLAYDDATGEERPGILVVHEWWGLNDFARTRAEELAREGYVALALDMYGEGKTTQHPQEAAEWSRRIRENQDLLRSRFLAAHDVLRDHPLTRDDATAAIGYCFGGFVVLQMAREGADLDAVASFHGLLPAGAVKADSVRARFLVCHGGSDPFVRPEQIQEFQTEMTAAGADWQFITYGGAKHSFTNPDAGAHGMEALAYDALAAERSWRAMLALFDEVFAR